MEDRCDNLVNSCPPSTPGFPWPSRYSFSAIVLVLFLLLVISGVGLL